MSLAQFGSMSEITVPDYLGLEPKKKLPTIAICIPHIGQVSMDFVTNTLFQFTTKSTWCNKLIMAVKNWQLTVSRNLMAERALENGADAVFFIDSDQVFEGKTPDTALKELWEMNVPVASGITRTKLDGFPFSAFIIDKKRNGPDNYDHLTESDLDRGIVKVDGTGLFCSLIRKEVFEKIGKPYFTWDDHTDGEDSIFHRRVREQEIAIYVNTLIRLGHIGEYNLATNCNLTAARGAMFWKVLAPVDEKPRVVD
jgi:hypothetical protein